MRNLLIVIFGVAVFFPGCKSVKTDLQYDDADQRIIFLHHSTGKNVWYGDVDQDKRFRFKEEMAMVPRLLKEYNEEHVTKISIEERSFPSGDPYPWKNYPYDYYNIWVKNAGEKAYMGEPTLEMLTKEYDVIVFKFCFPYSNILEDDGNPDVNSEKKTISNYKLQYEALKEKMHEFPETKFVVWTGAALVETSTSVDEANRAYEITAWVKEVWNEEGDNIEIFDFRSIETEGGLYLLPEYSIDPSWDSHPNKDISAKAASEFVSFIVEKVENIG